MDSSSLSTFRLRRRTPGSFVLVPCPQIGRSLRCQGQLERTAAVTIAACPLVKDVQEQPVQVWYSWRDTIHGLKIQLLPGGLKPCDTGHISYIVPDFLVSMRNGISRLIEVKPTRKLSKTEVQRKICVARLYALHSGWIMHVLTEQELLRCSLPRVLSLISRYRIASSDPIICHQILQCVPNAGIQIGQLVDQLGLDEAVARTHVFHLLADNGLTLDVKANQLGDETLVFPKGVNLWDPFDSVWASSSCSTGGPIEWSANSPTTALFPKMRNST